MSLRKCCGKPKGTAFNGFVQQSHHILYLLVRCLSAHCIVAHYPLPQSTVTRKKTNVHPYRTVEHAKILSKCFPTPLNSLLQRRKWHAFHDAEHAQGVIRVRC